MQGRIKLKSYNSRFIEAVFELSKLTDLRQPKVGMDAQGVRD
jgi:hypothetical protein